jgi:transcriptional regulator with XRE-family HTH domain
MPETFGEKLDRLFKKIKKPGGEEFSPEEIQVATNKSITASYIYRLRAGKSGNPTVDKVKALADFFGVSPSYFFEEEATEPTPDPKRIITQIDRRVPRPDTAVLEELVTMMKAIREAEDGKQKELV